MRFSLLAILMIALGALPASAQTLDARVAETIERLTLAYGGDALTSLSSVSIVSNRRLAWPGQGQTAGFVEFERDRLRKHFDLVREHGSVERWTYQNGNAYHNRYVVDQDGATALDYFDMTATPSERGGFWQWFNVDFRSSDALLAYRLATASLDIEYLGTAHYRGHLQDRIAFEVSTGTQRAIAYVSRRDGLIRRLTMEREIGEVNLLFSMHRRVDGVSYASEVHIYVGDTLTEYDQGLTFTPNRDVGPDIAIEDGFAPPAATVEQSEMTVDAIGGGAFMVGREDYGLFVLDDDGVIAVNAYAGLKDRYEALKEHLGREMPLRSVVVTHHHSDHMDAVGEAIELGATLHLTRQAHAVLEAERKNMDTVSIDVFATDDAVGPLSIHVRGTSHASENAFIYHAASKALFQDDHYHGLVAVGPTRVQPSAMEMYRIIEGLGLDVEFVLSGHARKAETWDAFAAATQGSGAGDPCPSRREICLS
ncbi:MAG: MBL fold metallo-hydrolase [Erythrobacter sp.]|nr:MBL fold metallo-hydrolase [Erythrobacter sp.]